MREVLLRDWDPLGIAGKPGAEGDYDPYGAMVFAVLQDEQSNAVAVGAFLFGIATQHMELAQTPELAVRCNKAGAALVALRPELEFP